MRLRRRRDALLLWAFGCALLLAGHAVPVRAASRQSLSYSLGLTTEYNDNFLEYSDNQLRDFSNGVHPLRIPLSSTDDGLFMPSVELAWQLDEGRGRRHGLRVRWEGDFHASNPTADYRSYGFHWLESYRGERRLALGYAKIGRYYLRHLKDEDLPVALQDYRWQRADFDLQLASIGWTQGVGRPANLWLGYRFEKRDYNERFKERTSGTHQGLATVTFGRLPKRSVVELSGGFRLSDARADDGDAIPGDDDDVSYHGLLAAVTGRREILRRDRWRMGGDLALYSSTRNYTSSVTSDTYHNGRNDLLVGVETGARVAYRPRLVARFYFRYEDNHANLGTIAPATSDSGSYRVHAFGLSLDWSGGLWHSTGDESQ